MPAVYGNDLTTLKLAPPDTCMAAGPDRLVTVVNSDMSIFDKFSMTRIAAFSIWRLWGGFFSDPYIVYDEFHQRFIASGWLIESNGTRLEVDAPFGNASVRGSRAGFGVPINQTFDVYAPLAIATPLDAVGGLLNAPGSLVGKIVIIKRGTTTFQEKARRAQVAGAVGVIIFDRTEQPEFTMGAFLAAGEVHIPVIGITLAAGNNLVALVAQNPGIYGRIVAVIQPKQQIAAIAISKTSSPSGPNDWWSYRYYFPIYPAVPFGFFTDFQKISVDATLIYYSTNNFISGNDNGGASKSVMAFDKVSLLNGPSAQIYTTLEFHSDEGLDDPAGLYWPAQIRLPITNPDLPSMFLVSARGAAGGSMRIRHSADDFASAIDVAYPAPMPLGNGVASQPDPTLLLDGYGASAPILFGNSLWISFRYQADPLTSVTRWFELDVSTVSVNGNITIRQWGDLNAMGKSISSIYSALNVDRDGNVAIAFTVTGPQQPPNFVFTGRLASDPLGTMRYPYQFITHNNRIYSDGLSDITSRWGDYQSCVVDPADQKTFWMFGEYPSDNSNDVHGRYSSAWMTAIGGFTINTKNGANQLQLPQPSSIPPPTGFGNDTDSPREAEDESGPVM
jgi:hypothetical protein